MSIEGASRMIARVYSLACQHCRRVDDIEKVSAGGAAARLAAPEPPKVHSKVAIVLVGLGVALGLGMGAAILRRLASLVPLSEPLGAPMLGGLALPGGGSVGLMFLPVRRHPIYITPKHIEDGTQ
jgi:hypothetical protein